MEQHAISNALLASSPRGVCVGSGLWRSLLILVALPACTIEVDASDYISYCEPGYERCGPLGIETCLTDGTAFQVTEVCGEDAQCVELECISGEILAETLGQPNPTSADIPDENPVRTNPPDPFIAPPGKLGNKLKINSYIHILDALPASTLDLGLCAGSVAASIAGEPPVCAGSLFLRITNTGEQLAGMLYRHEKGSSRIIPLLTQTYPMKTGEVYKIVFEDYDEEGLTDKFLRISTSIVGVFSGATAYHSELLPSDEIGVFGLWNYATDGSDEESLEGTLSGLTLRINGNPEITLGDFFALANEMGTLAQNKPNENFLGFYVTNAVATGMQLVLQGLNETSSGDLD